MCAQRVRAQAPAGPVTTPPPGTVPAARAPEPVPARQSILGAWKLNRDESDDPRQRMRDSRSPNGGGYGGRRGGGWPGGGGYGGRRGGMEGGESDEERQKMHELLSPPATMTLSMTRSFELSPDGRQLYENLPIDGNGRTNHTLDLHYVYDILVEADRK